LIRAEELTRQHYLAVPRRHSFSSPQIIDAAQILSGHRTQFRTPWKISGDEIRKILEESAAGKSSRELGLALGKHPSYIRHIRSKHARGRILDSRTSGLLVEQNTIRFPKEHRPGIPATIELNEELARLLGLYCAEGSVVQSKDRPNSLAVNFSFSRAEQHYAEEVRVLLSRYFGVAASR
jgi:hypothetical protein